jgi:small subunit ribosomal protein S16
MGLTFMAHSGTLLPTMLKMRLQRTGRKNNPSYRVIVTDSRNAAKRGKSVDLLGSYDPLKGRFTINAEKAKLWLSRGVQPSDTIYNFLVSEKIIEGKKKNVLSKKSPIIDEAKIKAEAEAKAKAEADAKAAEEAAKVAAEAPVEAEVVEAEVVAETPAEAAPVEEEKVA